LVTFAQQKIELLRSELPTLPSPTPAPASTATPTPDEVETDAESAHVAQGNKTPQERLKREIDIVQEGLNDLTLLRFVGVHQIQSGIANVALRIVRSHIVLAEEEQANHSEAVQFEFEAAYTGEMFQLWKFWQWPELLGIAYMDSERIFGVLDVVSGMLGAILAGLRRSIIASPQDYVLGALTGFVMYLALKGGKYVFLMSVKEGTFEFNPFSAAFLALIAGLLSERFYGFVTNVFDVVSDRLKKTAK
jgi:hypothetical protein